MYSIFKFSNQHIAELSILLQCCCATDDLEDLLGDSCLTFAVVLYFECTDELTCVIGRSVHRHHTRAMLRGIGIEQCFEKLCVQYLRCQLFEQGLLVRLEDIVILYFRSYCSCFFLFLYREETLGHEVLSGRIDKLSIDQLDHVILSCEKLISDESRYDFSSSVVLSEKASGTNLMATPGTLFFNFSIIVLNTRCAEFVKTLLNVNRILEYISADWALQSCLFDLLK